MIHFIFNFTRNYIRWVLNRPQISQLEFFCQFNSYSVWLSAGIDNADGMGKRIDYFKFEVSLGSLLGAPDRPFRKLGGFSCYANTDLVYDGASALIFDGVRGVRRKTLNISDISVMKLNEK